MTPEEAIACLDLLRALPDPWADEWSWLIGLAEDAGLEREDLAGLSFMEAVSLVRQMEEYWHFGGSLLDDWSLRLKSRHEGEVRAALVEGMDLPPIAQRLTVGRLVEVAQDHFAVCPRTFRLTQVKTVSIEIPIPYLPENIQVEKEKP